jgi:hypothetical protein
VAETISRGSSLGLRTVADAISPSQTVSREIVRNP